VDLHALYGGVVPELASRAHVESVNAVIEEALKRAKRTISSVDALAVTIGPGLVGSLLVGKMTAETLGWVYRKPVIGVNHIEGHLLSPVLSEPDLKPPFLGLVTSGGHTELIFARKWGTYELLGRTRDDAAGEAFDKVARMVGLGYPGGPAIDRLAALGKPEKSPFPRAWLPGTWDFSFSGLKTAVLYRLREKKLKSLQDKRDLCAGFQSAVVDVLVGKTLAAAQMLKVKTVVVGGGVAANRGLRRSFEERSRPLKIKVLIAPPELCTDNAAMIASAAYFSHQKKGGPQAHSLKVQPQWHIPFSSGPSRPSFSLSAQV
jgi:N6-L-threonylcarbamoyladenine synthase